MYDELKNVTGALVPVIVLDHKANWPDGWEIFIHTLRTDEM